MAIFVQDKYSSFKSFNSIKFGKLNNGLKDNVINFVEIDGIKYILNGNDRVRICERFLNKTDQLIFQEVSLPFRGYQTEKDVIGEAMSIIDNTPRGAK